MAIFIWHKQHLPVQTINDKQASCDYHSSFVVAPEKYREVNVHHSATTFFILIKIFWYFTIPM